jgi:1,4-alpha-glucan branching enzyme
MTLPGKKLLFMCNEIAQFREWKRPDEVEWFLLDYPMHAALQAAVSELNHLYLSHPALCEDSISFDGLRFSEQDGSLTAFIRRSTRENEIVVLLNDSPTLRTGLSIEGLEAGAYTALWCSYATAFGGTGNPNPNPLLVKDGLLTLTLPPHGACILQREATKDPDYNIGADFTVSQHTS